MLLWQFSYYRAASMSRLISWEMVLAKVRLPPITGIGDVRFRPIADVRRPIAEANILVLLAEAVMP